MPRVPCWSGDVVGFSQGQKHSDSIVACIMRDLDRLGCVLDAGRHIGASKTLQ